MHVDKSCTCNIKDRFPTQNTPRLISNLWLKTDEADGVPKYTVSQEFPDSVKNMLLLKNPQFLSNH